MKTMEDWNRLADPAVPWQHRYPEIEAEILRELNTLAPGERLTTQALVNRITKEARGVGILPRIYNAVAVCAGHGLKNCWTLGPPRLLFGRERYPKLWHKPPTPEPTTMDRVMFTMAGWIDCHARDPRRERMTAMLDELRSWSEPTPHTEQQGEQNDPPSD